MLSRSIVSRLLNCEDDGLLQDYYYYFFFSSTRMYRVDVLRVIFSNLLKFYINNKLIITNRDVESIDPASLLSLSVVRLLIVFVDRVLA